MDKRRDEQQTHRGTVNMDRQTDRRMDIQMEKWTYGLMDVQTDETKISATKPPS
jgi:hypothetical protein